MFQKLLGESSYATETRSWESGLDTYMHSILHLTLKDSVVFFFLGLCIAAVLVWCLCIRVSMHVLLSITQGIYFISQLAYILQLNGEPLRVML